MRLTQATALDVWRIGAHFDAHPLDAFSPSPAFVDFMADDGPRILVRAANRVGKTRHAAAKLAERMLRIPGRRYRAVAVNYGQSVQVVSKLLAEFIPASALAPGCRYTETIGWSHNLIRLRNGTTCQIKSSDQAPIAHAGDDLDGVWIDEPPPPAIWLESVKRVMSRNGWVWVTMTPINRPCGYLKDIVEAPGSPWRQYVVALTHANCPWYSPAQVETWTAEAAAAPWAFRQTIYGDWEGVSVGRLFTAFSEHHVGEPEDLPAELPLGIATDHGEQIGNQAAILSYYGPDFLYVVDEYENEQLTTIAQDAGAILAMLRRRGLLLRHVDKIVGDVNSAGKASAGAPGRKLNELLEEELNLQAGHPDVLVRVERATKGPILWGVRALNLAMMRRRVWIHPRCKRLIAALRYWDNTPATGKYKHFADCFRYLGTPIFDTGGGGPSYVTMVRER